MKVLMRTCEANGISKSMKWLPVISSTRTWAGAGNVISAPQFGPRPGYPQPE